MRVGVLSNLRAGRSRGQLQRVRAFLRGHPDVTHLETPSADEVPEALARFEREDVDVLALQGGDGTLARALTEILAHGALTRVPLLAALGGGRTNMSALDVGVQRSPVRALRTLFESLRHGTWQRRIVRRPVLRIELPGEGVVHHGMFFGAGVVPRAAEILQTAFPAGRAQGALGAGILTGGLIGAASFGRERGVLRPDKMQLRVDGDAPVTGEYLLAMATTLRRLFLGIEPFWGVEAGPVRFTTVAARPRRLARAAPGILRGRPGPHATATNGYASRNTHGVELLLDCALLVDGERWPAVPERHVRVSADESVEFLRL